MLVPQIVDERRHCPWDGQAFNKDYTANLTEALAKAAKIAGSALENALERGRRHARDPSAWTRPPC